MHFRLSVDTSVGFARFVVDAIWGTSRLALNYERARRSPGSVEVSGTWVARSQRRELSRRPPLFAIKPNNSSN